MKDAVRHEFACFLLDSVLDVTILSLMYFYIDKVSSLDMVQYHDPSPNPREQDGDGR